MALNSSIPQVVVISGPPAAGKTTLARRLGKATGLPVLSKDALKESMFDSLGAADRPWSRRLGLASYELMLQLLSEFARTGVRLIVENAFHATDGEAVNRALGGARALQVNCAGDPAVLLARFEQRVTSGERHPGHVDEVSELRAALGNRLYGPLVLRAETVVVNPGDSARFETQYRAVLSLIMAGAGR